MSGMPRRPLLIAALAWVVLDVAHFLDHVRQDRELPAEVQTVGITGYVATAILLYLIVRRHRLAPLYAAAFGISIVLGFTLVHFVPEWSAISDPYSGTEGVDGLAWVLAIVPALSGLALAATAARELRAPGPAMTA